MRKGMKLRKLLLIAVMALSVVMVSACSQKKSVLDDVKVKYEGYSGHGIADLDKKKSIRTWLTSLPKNSSLMII